MTEPRRRRWPALVWFLAAAAAPASAQVEPLTVRVADAEGTPGGPVAIVLRTYASRPVSQGRLGVRATATAPLTFEAALGAGPFATFDGGTIFSAQGDAIGAFDFDPVTQQVTADFSSPTETINAFDGVFGVLFFTLEAGLAPGAQYDLALDLGPTFELTDADGQPIPWEPRAGKLDVRGPGTPLALAAGGTKAHPGSGADVEIETREPFPVLAGRVELTYATDVLSAPLEVFSDVRHGSLQATVTFPAAGRLRIDFFSPDQDFNEVPGALFTVRMPTRAEVPLGTTRPLALDPAQTWLLGPGSLPLALALEPGLLEFEADPFVFYDAFETGTVGNWSARLP